MKRLMLLTLFAATPALAQEAPSKPAVQFEIDGNALVLPSTVSFGESDSRIAPGSEAALEHMRAFLEAKSYISTLRIEAHVAAGSDPAKAQKLSEERALAVARWLVSKGVDCKRVLPVGFGSTKPVADNSTPEGKAKNTRVVAVNAALRGRPIGGMPLDGGGAVAGDPCK